MSTILRWWCDGCKNEQRVVTGSLPILGVFSSFPHKEDCPSSLQGTWLQVHQGEYEDEPPAIRPEGAILTYSENVEAEVEDDKATE